jgi:hypothetical protein
MHSVSDNLRSLSCHAHFAFFFFFFCFWGGGGGGWFASYDKQVVLRACSNPDPHGATGIFAFLIAHVLSRVDGDVYIEISE